MALLLAACLVFLGSCNPLEDRQVDVDLGSSSNVIRGTTPVQMLATVTEGGSPLSTTVSFSASRGTFTGGGGTEDVATDSAGLAITTLQLPDDGDLADVDVTASVSFTGDDGTSDTAMAFKTLTVEPGGGR